MHESSDRITVSLETGHRDALQLQIMRQVLGKNTLNDQEALAWVDAKAEEVSDIIDAPSHEDIRALAREGKYGEAANRVIQLLETVN